MVMMPGDGDEHEFRIIAFGGGEAEEFTSEMPGDWLA
jgi:hypothetical protein